MTRRLASSSAPRRPLAGASTLAPGAAALARPALAVAGRERTAAAPAARLQELERLDVDQVLVLAHDVGLAHRLQELAGAVEVPQPDLHAAETLGHVAVRAGARDDPILPGELDRLLVERGERHPRIEDLEDVDVLD